MFAGFSLSLIESAGDLSHSVHLLLVLHAQGEEIDSLPGLVGGSGGGQNHRIAIVHERGAVGLFCHTVNINCQGSACQFHGITFVHSSTLLF